MFLVDGEPADVVPVSDRGFQYGDGVFETIRVVNGRLPLKLLHFRRLQRGCDRLRLPLQMPALEQQVERFIQGCEDGVLKITVTRGSGGRGYNPLGAKGRTVLGLFPRTPAANDWVNDGVRVKVCETRLGHSPTLAGLKHLNRLEQVLARGEFTTQDFAEGMVLDIHDNVIEGTMSNVFLVASGDVLVPDLSLCGVEGVMRQWLIDSFSQNVLFRVGQYTLDDVRQADEVFFANSVMGIWPVRECAGRTWLPGPVTRKFRKEVVQLFND
ncbi:aminodeoxychorismate lyase [Sansalvadorimonas verongulae]|nr:aminodeoxychorismate lyase [Sansalvadorimonas verongulae]